MKLMLQQRRRFRRLQRKYNVSVRFLNLNSENIKRFLVYVTAPHFIIKRVAERKYAADGRISVVLIYNRLTRMVFDPARLKKIKERKRNVKEWSKSMVRYLRNRYGDKVDVEESDDKPSLNGNADILANVAAAAKVTNDVNKQMKEQLELLKCRKRGVPLIADSLSVGDDSKDSKNDNVPENPHDVSIEDISNDGEEDTQCHSEQRNNSMEKTDKVAATIEGGSLEVTSDNQIVLKETGSFVTDILENSLKEKEQIAEKQQQQEAVRQHKQQESEVEGNKLPNDVEKPSMSSVDGDDGEIELSPSEILKEFSEENQRDQPDTDQSDLGDLVIDEPEEPQPVAPVAHPVFLPPKGNVNKVSFLDMLMTKVGVNTAPQHHEPAAMVGIDKFPPIHIRNEPLIDSGEDEDGQFCGFEESARLPGMLQTPIVPQRSKSKDANAAFVSESLNEYMRENLLDSKSDSNDEQAFVAMRKIRQAKLYGLVTPDCRPPYMDMPAVPQRLLKMRTVAERRNYLQKCSKNHKLTIINNEAAIYRELQRRVKPKQFKTKLINQSIQQSINSSMPFSRNGWQAASFLTTDYNKYYYQVLQVGDDSGEMVKLPGVRGNNDEPIKKLHLSRAIKPDIEQQGCPPTCIDATLNLKPILNVRKNNKLNTYPMPAGFKPCPLSHKPFQKPLDVEMAAVLLAGGSMAVVRMPTVELEVFPELGKPLPDVAKRYLQYILPHQDITREWAEFSVSTLNAKPRSVREAEIMAAAAVAKDGRRPSYTFAIPYLNDRNHILVRRVIDRSEKLDKIFEADVGDCEEPAAAQLTFRENLPKDDPVATECADFLGEMIHSVAISCCENSMIKDDPDGVNATTLNRGNGPEVKRSMIRTDVQKVEAKPRKQARLLNELKRLNATVISADCWPGKETVPCKEEQCAMGCVCQSLSDGVPKRQHCGKPNCMFECSCKGTAASRMMRFETDGRSLTTEDAFNLRRKATARLARMEKDFTSTVVLNGNETLLINESQYDKKRRCTKMPKRYEDNEETTDEYNPRQHNQHQNPNTSPTSASSKTVKSGSVVTIEAHSPTSSNSNIVMADIVPDQYQEAVFVAEDILEQMKHCTVDLVRFDDCKNMETWCMVHELYKCFCNGRAVTGVPMIIEKEEKNETIANNDGDAITNNSNSAQTSPSLMTTRARYSFQKVDDSVAATLQPSPRKQRLDTFNSSEHEATTSTTTTITAGRIRNARAAEENQTDRETEYSYNSEPEIFAANEDSSDVSQYLDEDYLDLDAAIGVENDYSTIKPRRRGRRCSNALKSGGKEKRVLNKFYAAHPDTCRRAVAVPRMTYKCINARRRVDVQTEMSKNESPSKRYILQGHIMRSVDRHKIEVEKLRKEKEEQLANRRRIRVKQWHDLTDMKQPKRNDDNSHVLQLIDEDADSRQSSEMPTTSKRIAATAVGKRTHAAAEWNKDEEPSVSKRVRNGPVPIDANSSDGAGTAFDADNFNNITDSSNPTQDDPSTMPIQLKISSCFSLRDCSLTTAMMHGLAPSANEETTTGEPGAAAASRATTSPFSIQQGRSSPSTSAAAAAAAAAAPSQPPPLKRIRSLVRPADLQGFAASKKPQGEFLNFYNGIIRNINNLVTKKMQDIDVALKRESLVVPTPSSDNLCIIRWSNFYSAFKERFVYIWEVRMQDHVYMAATVRNILPVVPNALGVVNIAAADPQRLPLMGHFLMGLKSIKSSEKLAVAMQGRCTYWKVKGFLRQEVQNACARPTPESHPSLARKINVLCDLLVKQRLNDLRRTAMRRRGVNAIAPGPPPLAQMTANRSAARRPGRNDVVLPLTAVQQQQMTVAEKAKLPKAPLNDVAKPTRNGSTTLPVEKPARAIGSNTFKSNLLISSIPDDCPQLKTNIKIRKVRKEDITDIVQPEANAHDHRWLVLDLRNDFSHIFVPDFKDLVSLDRIRKVMALARLKRKMVKLQFFQNAPYDAFVTPTSYNKLYFGPLKLNMRPPTLILMRRVGNQMLLREVYQNENAPKISAQSLETTAFWLLQINGQVQYEFENNNEESQPLLTLKTDELSDSDEDCYIVDSGDESNPLVVKASNEGQPKYTVHKSVKSNDMQVIRNVDLSRLGGGSSNGPPSGSDGNNKSLNTMATNSPLPTLPFNLPSATSLIQLPPDTGGLLPLLNMAQNAVITGVAPAPSDAPYGQTIYLRTNQTPSGSIKGPTYLNSEVEMIPMDDDESVSENDEKDTANTNSTEKVNTENSSSTSTSTTTTTKTTTTSTTTAKATTKHTEQPTTTKADSNKKGLTTSTEPNTSTEPTITKKPSTEKTTSAKKTSPAKTTAAIADPSPKKNITETSPMKPPEQNGNQQVLKRRQPVPLKSDSPNDAQAKRRRMSLFNDFGFQIHPVVPHAATALSEIPTTTTTSSESSTEPTAGTTDTNTKTFQKPIKICRKRRSVSAALNDQTPAKKSSLEDVLAAWSDSNSNTSCSSVSTSDGSQQEPHDPLSLENPPDSSIETLSQLTTTTTATATTSPSTSSTSSSKTPISPGTNILNFNNTPVKCQSVLNSQFKIIPKPQINGMAGGPQPGKKGSKSVITVSRKLQKVPSMPATTVDSTRATTKSPTTYTITAGSTASEPNVQLNTRTSIGASQPADVKKPVINIKHAVNMGRRSLPAKLVAIAPKPNPKPAELAPPSPTTTSAKSPSTATTPAAPCTAGTASKATAPPITKIVIKSDGATPAVGRGLSVKPTPTSTKTSTQQTTSPSTSPSTSSKQQAPIKRENGQVAATASTLTHQQNLKKPSDEVEYGYFMSSISGGPRFVAKRIRSDYIIKMPHAGILQLNGMVNVNFCLNQHMYKYETHLLDQLPCSWRFQPQERLKLRAGVHGDCSIPPARAPAPTSTPKAVQRSSTSGPTTTKYRMVTTNKLNASEPNAATTTKSLATPPTTSTSSSTAVKITKIVQQLKSAPPSRTPTPAPQEANKLYIKKVSTSKLLEKKVGDAASSILIED